MTGKQNFTPLIDENWWQSTKGNTTLNRCVSLSPDEVDQLVVSDLVYTWDLYAEDPPQPGQTIPLAHAIEVVLEHYLPPAEYAQWKVDRVN